MENDLIIDDIWVDDDRQARVVQAQKIYGDRPDAEEMAGLGISSHISPDNIVHTVGSVLLSWFQGADDPAFVVRVDPLARLSVHLAKPFVQLTSSIGCYLIL